MLKKVLSLAALILCFAACSGTKSQAAGTENNESMDNETANLTQPADTASAIVEVETTLGNFTVLLYGDTPKHRDNFLKLVDEHYYDSLLFHRVIKEFMVQGGDPDSKTAQPGQMLGGGDPGYTIEAEILFPKHYHKRGALAAARTGDQVNPERRSSGSQFYVVTGKQFPAEQLEQMAGNLLFDQLAQQNMEAIRRMQMNSDRAGLMAMQDSLGRQVEQMLAEGKGPYTPEMIETYATIGGTPHLDGQYTVFGEVLDGMETIERIENVATGAADRPVEDVRIISAKVIKR